MRERLDDPALSAPALFNYVDARDVATFAGPAAGRDRTTIPNGEVFFVGADDALAREPLADLLPRFLPGTAELAAGLTGTSPASRTPRPAPARLDPTRIWRTELAEPTIAAPQCSAPQR